MEHFVIIGGGLAAHQAAKSLISARPDAHVSMVSAERQLPYDRPHLSKGFLTSERIEPLFLSESQIYAGPQFTLITGSSVVEIDRTASCVRMDNGKSLSYDKLVIATGSRVRKLSGNLACASVNYLRTFDDAVSLRSRLVANADVVIIGGGFIGLEVAAAARKRNCRVTVIEPQARLLARTGSRELSEWVYGLHAAQGVNIQLGVSVERIEENFNGKTVIETSAGQLIADIVIAGIGVQPNIELAEACGLLVDDGIVVNSACTTSDPNIYAAGEVTNYPIEHLGVRARSESWTVARDQGSVAGRAVAGDLSAAYSEVPWLWSDQYSSNIQCIGITKLADKYSLIGEVNSEQWLALGWDTDDQLVCAIAANRGRDISMIRRAIKHNNALPEIYASRLASATSPTPN